MGDLGAIGAIGQLAVRWLVVAFMLCWVLVQIIGRVLAIFRANADWLDDPRRRRPARSGGQGTTCRRGRGRLVG